eukprot:CAMPEP_0177152210 /NCGR_PEP_ID=MMETSP0367-20130122/399_1 /TAXON_ID=447022 ORGANISM="Scrippsiella hangoei-like, Strain SHHI-4" /NCGR_SAMPLE_ID=MMETSP0367 /ASSEMBLY_ACC=CAM_ASM_000362 /LENGTH=35 /DNA_ID= /DNA_START= /DNA_END= /DNA_ORIENTATION=
MLSLWLTPATPMLGVVSVAAHLAASSATSAAFLSA